MKAWEKITEDEIRQWLRVDSWTGAKPGVMIHHTKSGATAGPVLLKDYGGSQRKAEKALMRELVLTPEFGAWAVNEGRPVTMSFPPGVSDGRMFEVKAKG